MKAQRIYLSGPISGHDLNERRQVFKKAQLLLQEQGYEVFNPMENGLPPESPTHKHMRRDIDELLRCDTIYFLPRWTHSKGCMVEFHVATAIGLSIIFEEVSASVTFK